MIYFQIIFLEEADKFISQLDVKTAMKVFYNIDLAQQTNDPKLFKKLQNDIWEFRTKYNGLQIRLLAFWDKSSGKDTLVVATHGFIKKVDKVPKNELNEQQKLEQSILKINNKEIMATKKNKSYTLSEMKDKYIGKTGEKRRDEYEYELSMDVLGRMIKTTRQERNLTQEQLGQMVGVQKSQISKLESSTNSATIDTILKVFKALKAEIHFNVTPAKQHVQLA